MLQCNRGLYFGTIYFVEMREKKERRGRSISLCGNTRILVKLNAEERAKAREERDS